MDDKRENVRDPEDQRRNPDQQAPMEEHPKKGWDEGGNIEREPMEDPNPEHEGDDEDISHGMK
jgi:hypothetical protein